VPHIIHEILSYQTGFHTTVSPFHQNQLFFLMKMRLIRIMRILDDVAYDWEKPEIEYLIDRYYSTPTLNQHTKDITLETFFHGKQFLDDMRKTLKDSIHIDIIGAENIENHRLPNWGRAL